MTCNITDNVLPEKDERDDAEYGRVERKRKLLDENCNLLSTGLYALKDELFEQISGNEDDYALGLVAIVLIGVLKSNGHTACSRLIDYLAEKKTDREFG